MIRRIEEFARDVRVCIDQNNQSSALLVEEDVDQLGLDEVIRSKLADAVREVHLAAPVELLETRSFGDGPEFGTSAQSGGHGGPAVYWTEKECGYVIVPSDALRVVGFKMSDWARPVYDFEASDGVMHRLMSSRVKALRGSWEFPRACVCMRGGRLVVEFASCRDETAYVSWAEYIPEPVVEGGGIEVSRHCYRSAVYVAAALTVESLGDYERSAALRGRGMEMLGIGG